ncbi:hypothetical protein LTR94_037498, partial [Friedmanniomyces endolithicus]
RIATRRALACRPVASAPVDQRHRRRCRTGRLRAALPRPGGGQRFSDRTPDRRDYRDRADLRTRSRRDRARPVAASG